MEIIILIPFVIAVVALFRYPVARVFTDVCLPVFLLLPIYYYWKVASLPPIDATEAVLIPVGIAMVLKEMPRWRLTTMDLWLAVFIFSSYYADSVREHHVASIFNIFHNLTGALIPYMAGKLLVEQPGVRVRAVKRIVILIFFACIVSVYEYRMGQNPSTVLWSRFFPGEFSWRTQIRWGFGRVAGPYGQSELAGMILFTALVFTLWLAHEHQWEDKFKRWPTHPLKKSTIIAWAIGFTMLMTQARGPWLGALMAVPLAMVGRAKNVLRRFVVVSLLLAVAGAVGYLGLKKYAETNNPTSSEQETAQYRQHLLENYIPVAIAGGAWGYGGDFPRAPGQNSVDNEYLFVTLTQGWVGLASFCLLAFEAGMRFTTAALMNRRKSDRAFAFSMLGIFVGILLTIFTVFLGNQTYELFFLLVGWSQALRVRPADLGQPVFEHVYT